MKLFEKAKTRNLVEIAEKSGFVLRKQGAGYAAKHCPHCHPGGNDAMSIYPKDGIWRWNCFRCSKGGTVVDFAAAVWGIPERDAAMRLANGVEFGEAEIPSEEKRGRVSGETMKTALTKLLQSGHTSVRECLDYLKRRGISEKTVAEAVRRGILRFLPANPFQANKFLIEHLGIGTLRDAGFLKPGSRWPGIAFRPMAFFFPGCTAAEFRIAHQPKEGEPKAIRYGNVKWPWWWKEGDPVSTIYVVEGVIDLLSMVELGLKSGEGVIGIPGTTSWKQEWFSAARTAHPGAKFVIALDADDAGKQAAYGIREFLESIGAPVSERMPAQGQDWNEFLIFSRAA
jgi:DNA primase